jgi:hypothetical protein
MNEHILYERLNSLSTSPNWIYQVFFILNIKQYGVNIYDHFWLNFKKKNETKTVLLSNETAAVRFSREITFERQFDYSPAELNNEDYYFKYNAQLSSTVFQTHKGFPRKIFRLPTSCGKIKLPERRDEANAFIGFIDAH